MVWYSKVKGLTEKVIELYPRMSSREIAEITGFVKTTIIRCVAKNHLRHTEEIKKKKVMKISKKCNTHTIEIKKDDNFVVAISSKANLRSSDDVNGIFILLKDYKSKEYIKRI